MKFNIWTYYGFYLGYLLAEFIVQKNMWFPDYLRWHLSDFFCGPTIVHTLTLAPFILFRDSIDIHGKEWLYLLSPVLNLLVCIFWELNMDKHYDIIDIYCYIGGTVLYYLTCIDYKRYVLQFQNTQIKYRNTI